MIDTTKQQDTYSAIRWSAASKYGAQAVQLGVSLLLARLLAPEYFGLLGMATVITGFAKTLKNLGFNAAIIQRQDIDQKLLSTLFWVNLGFCSLITLALVSISPLVAWLYQDSRVTPLVAVLSLNILINSFCTVPSALLQRRLEFKKLAIREIGGVVVSGATGITCALLGWGVWSLVAASMASSITNVVLLNIVEPFWPSWTLDRTRLKECLEFGLNITGFNVFNYFMRNSDNLIIGIFLGPVALGYYSLAYKFMLLPRDSITRVLTRVLFPKFSRLQEDDVQLANVYLKAIGCIAFITFPAMAGFAVLADSFVCVMLGAKWLPVIPLIWVLVPIGAIQSIWPLTGQILLAKGRANWYFRQGMIRGLMFVGAFLLGVKWGVLGVAVAFGITCLIWTPIAFWIAILQIKALTWSRVFGNLFPSLVLTILMVCSMLMCQYALVSYGTDSKTILIISSITGAACFVISALAIRPRAIGEILKILPIKTSDSFRMWLMRERHPKPTTTV